jgi:hypothetical protein
MALYSDAAIVRAVVKAHLHGQLIENVFFLRTKNANIPDNEIAATVRDKILNYMQQSVSDEYVAFGVTVQEIFPVKRDPYELALTRAGLQVGLAAPSLVAAIVSLKTGFGGRRNRGRKYVAGLLRDNIDQSIIDAPRVTSMQSEWDSINSWFQQSNNLSNLTWGILHRTLNGAPVPLDANAYVPITSVVVQSIAGSMRTRRPGRGA